MKHRHFRHALALSLLALAVLAVYARVLFTPLIPATATSWPISRPTGSN